MVGACAQGIAVSWGEDLGGVCAQGMAAGAEEPTWVVSVRRGLAISWSATRLTVCVE